MSRDRTLHHPDRLPDTPLDRAADAVRSEVPDSATSTAARERVWARIQAETGLGGQPSRPVESCDDYQALIPAYLAGDLAAPRALLVEEHSRSCLVCRKALIAARTGAAETTPGSTPAAADSHRRWPRLLAAAAVLALTVLATGWLFQSGLPFGPAAVIAEIEAVDGALLTLADGTAVGPLEPGASLLEGQRVRTTKQSGAVLRLADGSRIEMAERAELSLDRGWSGTTIDLDGGRILVEAAKQKDGELHVATQDCQVAVVGTVFSVNHGVKGSRVSVLEGEVRVARRGGTDVLLPGDQLSTDPRLAAVPIRQEIAWSRDAERYEALLAELDALRQELVARVPQPDLRFTSRLLPVVPAETVAYLGAPNLSEALDVTYTTLRQQLAESPELARLWQEHVVASGLEEPLETLVTRVRDLGSMLGDEVVVALAGVGSGTGGVEPCPLILAEAVDARLDEHLAQEIARLEAEQGEASLTLVEDVSDLTGDPRGLLVWTGGGFLAASPCPVRLARTIEVLEAGATTAFTTTGLHARLAESYDRGVQWIGAVALDRLIDPEPGTGEARITEAGAANLEHALLERRRQGDATETRASLFFDGPREGVFSWLAAPAPMRSLDFVSAEATVALAGVTKEPVEMLADLASFLRTAGTPTPSGLEELSRELGFDVEQDLAAALGGEITVAVDGPMLQGIPWKLVLEVYDADRLQMAFEQLAERATDEGSGTRLEETTVAGQRAWTLTLGNGVEIHYLYTDGFLVAAPRNTLLARALRVRDAGGGLVASARFRDLLPRDGETHFSALFFQDTGDVSEGLEELGLPRLPTSLAFVYGHPDQLEMAMMSAGDGLGLELLFERLSQGLEEARHELMAPTAGAAPAPGGPSA